MADKSKMKCNSPTKSDRPGKRKMVKACAGGKEKLIHFGDSKMGMHKEDSGRKKNYCARSGGIKGGSGKLSANYWARKDWNC
jgi:hypothetical protein